ncbi:MAG: hypothetical protein VKL39_11985 [Leptolyngbyaceae bacterium]|nr:hypothetical protein [Leptolyngbyaceae bacterium]
MNLSQDQIVLLHSKIDGLHRIVEQLSEQLTSVLSSGFSNADRNEAISVSMMEMSRRRSPSISSSYDDEMIGHKDVISEPDYVDSDRSNSEHPLTPEVQIQRLTAQLTAAYNRIAALEEQLLAHRIH